MLAGQPVQPLYYGPDYEDGDFGGIGRDADHPDTDTAVAREIAAFTAEIEVSRALAADLLRERIDGVTGD